MNKGVFFRYTGIIIILLIVSLNSRGSVILPLLNHSAVPDSIPPKQEQPVTETVIKEVPKAKKQIKPIAIPSAVLPVKTPIVKPKIVIKRIGVHIP